MCYLKPKIVNENIKELDLTSCYWLKSVDIQKCALKLPNLEAFHVADTSLTTGDLMKVLCSCCKIKQLSWSWNPVFPVRRSSLPSISSISSPSSLEFLFLYIKTGLISDRDRSEIGAWLSMCIDLRELWIILPEQESDSISHSWYSYSLELQFRYLHTLVVSSFNYPSTRGYLTGLYSVIMEGCRSCPKNWQCFWTSGEFPSRWPCITDGFNDKTATLMLSWKDARSILDNCYELQHLSLITSDLDVTEYFYQKDYESLKKLCWKSRRIPVDWNLLWNSSRNLEELNIATCVKKVEKMHRKDNLRKLALPSCIILDGCSQSNQQTSRSNSAMEVIIETCPDIEEFELLPCLHCSSHVCQQPRVWQESSFVLFAKWQNLRRFKLEKLDFIRSGSFFTQIFKSCEKLESISLKNLGLSGHCNYLYELCRALKFCKNLRDFRIEQAAISSADRLFRALQTCPLIQRVCVISINRSNLSSESLLAEFVSGAPKLVFLYVFLDTLTEAECRRIKNEIFGRITKNVNPALHVTVLGETSPHGIHHDITKVPGIHYFQMVKDVSRIGTQVGNGNWYLSSD
ncbi:F-box/LRR-repeat protein 18-like isoform X2 [Zootermopsis nevadensis]|nr:F-box/LRR-repeat protein 18-like isoform X2 [Zootermopsis nevadensis]